MKVFVPKTFFDDHEERDLPTPMVLAKRGSRYLVSLDDPALSELLSDARYYSDGVDDCDLRLVRSARLTVEAILQGELK